MKKCLYMLVALTGLLTASGLYAETANGVRYVLGLDGGLASVKSNMASELDKKGSAYSLLAGAGVTTDFLNIELMIGLTQTKIKASSDTAKASEEDVDVRNFTTDLAVRYRLPHAFEAGLATRVLIGEGAQFSPTSADKKGEMAVLLGPQVGYALPIEYLPVVLKLTHLVDVSIKNRVLQMTTFGVSLGLSN